MKRRLGIPRLVRWIGFALLVFGWMILLEADNLVSPQSYKMLLRLLVIAGTVRIAWYALRRRPEGA